MLRIAMEIISGENTFCGDALYLAFTGNSVYFLTMATVCIYDRVTLQNGKTGIVQFMGPLPNKQKTYYGIKLDEAVGKNNGYVGDIQYFECNERCGIFTTLEKIKQSEPTQSNETYPRVTLNDSVYIKSKQQYGTLQFVGNINITKDKNHSYGVELNESFGENDGSFDGRQYFNCSAKHGIFCTAEDILKADDMATIHNLQELSNVISIVKEPHPDEEHSQDEDEDEDKIIYENYGNVQSDINDEESEEDAKESASNASFQDMNKFYDDHDDNDDHPQIGKTVVIDGGTYNSRIGISGERKPAYVVDTAQDWAAIQSQEQQPLVYGAINQWDKVQKLWLNLIEGKLKFDTSEHPIVLTETHDVTKDDRNKLTELIFEGIQAPAFYVSPSSLFSLYSTGRTSGCVLDFAYDCSRIVPIYEGYVLQLNSKTIKIGGQHISHQLAMDLEKSCKISHLESFNLNILEEIKRKHCCVSSVWNKKNVKDAKYKLPDGQVITITPKMAMGATDVLFEQSGLIEQTQSSIMDCDEQSYSAVFNNMVISGGTALLHGVKEKILDELSERVRNEKRTMKEIVHVVKPNNAQLSAWIGASIFSSLSSFSRALVTIQEYQECGARIVHHKCF